MGRVEVKPGPLLAVLGLLLLYLLMIARGGGDQTAADKRENPQKQARTVKNPHSYSYTLNPGSSVCGEGRVDLLVLVASALKHGDRRSAVRKTWGASNQDVKVLFLLGGQKEGKEDMLLEEEIQKEWKDFRDLVREDFVDSYQNLTLKTLGGMRWASKHCPQATWVMKTDDDMYVNLHLLKNHLQRAHPRPHRLITGCVKNGPQGAPQPIGHNGATFAPVHPPFTAGAGYVLSGDLPGLLFHKSLDLRLIKVEDAFLTGYCARALGGVEKVHNPNFSCGQLVAQDCDMASHFTGHKVTPGRMVDIHSLLQSGDC